MSDSISPIPPSADTLAAAAAQVGRPIQAPIRAVYPCHLGLPVVLENAPHLPSGRPFPTLYWLTCPEAVKRVSRLEAAGAVRQMEARRAEDPEFAEALAAAHIRYAERRASLADQSWPHQPRGGIAGCRVGVKCLHAHLADHLAGNDNPVGALAAAAIGPLDCPTPCVVVKPKD